MAALPQNNISTALDRAYGKFSMVGGICGTWKVSISGNETSLYHYETRILSVDSNAVSYLAQTMSLSDENGCNSLLMLLGLNDRVRLRKGYAGLITA